MSARRSPRPKGAPMNWHSLQPHQKVEWMRDNCAEEAAGHERLVALTGGRLKQWHVKSAAAHRVGVEYYQAYLDGDRALAAKIRRQRMEPLLEECKHLVGAIKSA